MSATSQGRACGSQGRPDCTWQGDGFSIPPLHVSVLPLACSRSPLYLAPDAAAQTVGHFPDPSLRARQPGHKITPWLSVNTCISSPYSLFSRLIDGHALSKNMTQHSGMRCLMPLRMSRPSFMGHSVPMGTGKAVRTPLPCFFQGPQAFKGDPVPMRGWWFPMVTCVRDSSRGLYADDLLQTYYDE